MRCLVLLPLMFSACAEVPEATHDEAAAAVSGLPFAPNREGQVARLLAEAPLDEAGVREAVEQVRAVLDVMEAAARAGDWSLGPRASRDDWEALAWLAYGDARLRLLEGDADGAFERALMVHDLGLLMGEAEGAGITDLIVSLGLREAGLVQVQRLAALAPLSARGAEAIRGRIGEEGGGLSAWGPALTAEAAAAEARVAALRDDPVGGLGLVGESLPPAARSAPDLFDEAATREAVVGLMLRAADLTPDGCARSLAPDAPPAPGPNLAGRAYAFQTGLALAQLADRLCVTEAARRATIIALAHHAGADAPVLADPFTGKPFARIGDALVSGGRDRIKASRVGTGPFDAEAPTYFLDARPLLTF